MQITLSHGSDLHNPPNYNSEQLAKHISRGNADAFGQLYRKQYARVYAKALKITKCADLAADVTHDVFLRIWEYRLRLKYVKCLEGYLYTTCKNVATDALNRSAREQKVRAEIMYRFPESEEHSTDEPGLEDYCALLARAMECLPTKRKQVFISCKLHGQSHSHVASKFGISTGTVNDHLVKAMKSIRKFFKCHDA